MEFHRKTFELSLGILVIADLLATIAFVTPYLSGILFGLGILTVFVIALRRFEIAVLILLAELFMGAQGRLLSVTVAGFSVSLRQGLFAAVALGYGWHLLRGKYRVREIPMFWWIAGFAILCVTGTLAALYYGNARSDIFFDANGYLYILMAWPILSAIRAREHVRQLLSVLFASVIFLVLKALLLLGLFSHSYFFVPELYRAVRDTRMYEIVALPGAQNLYRIFSQSQLYSLIALFVAVPLALAASKETRRLMLPVLAAITIVLVLSLSRSYWLALLVAGLVLLVLLFRDSEYKTIRKPSTWGIGALIIATSALLIAFTINYPYLWGRTGGANPLSLLSERSTSINDSAASSRYALLLPLAKSSLRHPVFGSGFGTTVTYQSQDPRIVAATGGSYTTFAFEWGFLDIALKLGILGVVVILGWIIALMRRLWKAYKRQTLPDDRSVVLGTFCAVIALAVTHATSPYINHPLGIGMLIIATAIASVYAHEPTNADS